MFLSFRAHFRNLEVRLSLDPLLLPHLDTADRVSTNRTITFTLFDLIYAVALIQSRWFDATRRPKFADKADIAEKLHDTREFRVRIAEIRNRLSPEDLTTISADLGVGLSVVIATKLFNIRFSTITRLTMRGLRPDWTCQTADNRTLVFESKGSTRRTYSINDQEPHALAQKRTVPADVQIASLSILNENAISETRFIDPPTNFNDMDAELQNRILRASHYASVFSFLGHPVFSKYFAQMRMRLENNISSDEMERKNNTFHLILNRYDRVSFRENTYVGTFFEVNDGNFLYIGIDIRLISYEGFLNFQDYTEDTDVNIQDNHYVLKKDGVLIIEITNINAFSDEVNIPSIKNYQEFITLGDIDEMTGVSFEKYIVYVLQETGFNIIRTQLSRDFGEDIVAVRNQVQYVFELKLYKNRNSTDAFLTAAREFSRKADADAVKVFVTNLNIAKRNINVPGLKVIDRGDLKKIIKDKNELINLITFN